MHIIIILKKIKKLYRQYIILKWINTILFGINRVTVANNSKIMAVQ